MRSRLKTASFFLFAKRFSCNLFSVIINVYDEGGQRHEKNIQTATSSFLSPAYAGEEPHQPKKEQNQPKQGSVDLVQAF
jgi:hypothetical protein